VINNMNQFPHDSDIQRVCCFFLYKVIQDDESGEVCELIVKAGGQRVILAAIENHPEADVYESNPMEYEEYQYSNIQKNARSTMKALMEGPPVTPKQQQDTKSKVSTPTPAQTPSRSNPNIPPSTKSSATKSPIASRSAATANNNEDGGTNVVGSIFKKMNLF
jgi:hypothetical protein